MPAHRLGPHIVGQRVVLRRLLVGEWGPSGGPAFTDVLGELLQWSEAGAVVRAADGTEHRVPLALVVSGKPVPPRASPRLRIGADQLQHAAARSFPARVREPLGAWLLRDDRDLDPVTHEVRRVARRSSVLAVGDPQTPYGPAIGRVSAWYADRGRHPWASVVEGSEAAERFAAAGWVRARREAPTQTWVGSVSRALRALQPYAREDVVVSTGHDPHDMTVLLHQAHVVSAGEPESTPVATGRCAIDPANPDTVGILGLVTDVPARRCGLARAVLHGLLDRAAESGARTVWLQALADNGPASSLCGSVHLAPHHRSVYLAAPLGATMT